MSGMPWIKLYSEFLDDPKLARLNDSVKLRYVQLLLMAGECDAEGYLVQGTYKLEVQDIAWRLRIDPDVCRQDMEAMAGLVIYDSNVGAWLVVKFAERQGRSQEERRASWREHQDVSRKNMRESVYERSGGKCEYCGREIDFETYVVDHIVPANKGGTSKKENLAASCRSCNAIKGERFIDDLGWENPRTKTNVIDDKQNVIDDKQNVIALEKRREEKSREEGEGEREKTPAPKTYPDDYDFAQMLPAHYDRVPELKMFKRVTRRIPGSLQLNEIVTAIRREGLSERDLVEPWRHWAVIRGYKPEALSWLTEWAPAYKRGEKPWERQQKTAGSGNNGRKYLPEEDSNGNSS